MRILTEALVLAGWAMVVAGCSQAPEVSSTASSPADDVSPSAILDRDGASEDDTMPKTDEEWRAKLSPEQFDVLRREGTERAYTGEYLKHDEAGVYRCAGCGAQLYNSDVKFEQGGWPNFEVALPGAVGTRDVGGGVDEVHCAKCEGHLGHIFNDGPGPTRKRH